MLIKSYPQSIHQLATDVIPEDELADHDTWQGQWIERKWTPFTRAAERRLRDIVQLFQVYSHGQVPTNVPSDRYLPNINNNSSANNNQDSHYSHVQNTTGTTNKPLPLKSNLAK